MSPVLLLAPLAVQGLAMSIDELWFHRRRGLPRWERLGHPLDTLTVIACYSWALAMPFARPGALGGYVVLASFSCLFITKDEWVHAARCSPGEHWLHSVLFVLHPIVLGAAGLLWSMGDHRPWIAAQLGLALAFALYQLTFWRFLWRAPRPNAIR
jgi:hypothetical protein